MSALATILARFTWFWIIYWMRRPWMRKVHLSPMVWMRTEARKAKFIDTYKKQNRLARRIGLPMLKVVYFVFIASFALQVAYWIAVSMNERGWLSPTSLESHRITEP